MGVQIAFDFGEPHRTSPPAPTPVQAVAPAPSRFPAPPRESLSPADRPSAGQRVVSAISEPPAVQPTTPRWSRYELEQALIRRTGIGLSLLLTDNERTMISTRKQAGRFIVRVHHMFQHADAAVLEALAGYLTRSDRDAGPVLGDFIDAHRGRIRRAKPRRILLRPVGEHHDLSAIFEQLNRRYFGGRVDAHITWARRTTPKAAARTGRTKKAESRRSIKLGSYSSRDALIRIHPVLDQAWVPDFFVAFIVYHEMLHQVVPPRRVGARREFHGPDFRDQERRFDHYEQALAWEQRHLRRLLRA